MEVVLAMSVTWERKLIGDRRREALFETTMRH
jgi:hypothetical protein